MIRRWDQWRSGRYDTTPLWKLCLMGAFMGVTMMGFGELLLRLAA